MTNLRTPLKNALRTSTHPAVIRRMWTGIEARTNERPRPMKLGWAGAAFAFALLSLTLAVVWPQLRSAPTTTAGPVVLASGAPWVPVNANTDERLSLSDGSFITLAKASTLEPLHNSGNAVVLEQASGHVGYDIAPGGPRRWTIGCGPVTVEVVGTSFVVDRSVRRIRVDVAHGTVLVRGERVPDRVARLTAGMSIEVPLVDVPPPPERALAPGSGEPDTTNRPAPSSSATSVHMGTPESAKTRSFYRFAAHGDNAKAYSALGSEGIAREAATASVEDLFVLADVARRSGHPRDAVLPLNRILDNHAGDSRAPLAALTLGRISLRSLGDPATASRSLERAVSLGVPSGLAEETHVLLIESLAKTGNLEGARRAHTRYAALFPDGARAAEAKRWLER